MTSIRRSDGDADDAGAGREAAGAASGVVAPRVREITPGEAAGLRAAWSDLLGRAVEPNVMHGPDFLLPALETFAPDARLLVAERGEGAERRLVGVMAVSRPRLGFGLAPRLPAVFSNAYAPLGTPVIDADGCDETLAALLGALARRDGAVVLRHLPLDGAFAAALERVAAAAGHRLEVVESHARARLRGGPDGASFLRDHVRQKRRKEWRRLWRRLTEIAPIRTSVARGDDARAAFADFLELETSGWKGRRHTALAQDTAVAEFAARVVDGLAECDGVVVDRIDRDDRPLAMLISFGVAGHWVSWKTAYDEDFAGFSPGVQVVLRATTRFLDDGGLVDVDSLAIEDHPLIDHVWSDRRRIGTVVVGFAAPPHVRLAVRFAVAEFGLHLAVRRFAGRLRRRLSR